MINTIIIATRQMFKIMFIRLKWKKVESKECELGSLVNKYRQNQESKNGEESPPEKRQNYEACYEEDVDLSWVNWDEFLDKLSKKVNVPINGYIYGIAIDGCVYVQFVLFHEVIWDMAKKMDRRDFTKYSVRDYKRGTNIAKAVGKYLGQMGALCPIVNEQFCSKIFNVVDHSGNVIRSSRFIPIKGNVFTTSEEELNARIHKIPWLNCVKAAIPKYI